MKNPQTTDTKSESPMQISEEEFSRRFADAMREMGRQTLQQAYLSAGLENPWRVALNGIRERAGRIVRQAVGDYRALGNELTGEQEVDLLATVESAMIDGFYDVEKEVFEGGWRALPLPFGLWEGEMMRHAEQAARRLAVETGLTEHEAEALGRHLSLMLEREAASLLLGYALPREGRKMAVNALVQVAVNAVEARVQELSVQRLVTPASEAH